MVNQRSEHVHQQDGQHHTLRITWVQTTYHNRDETADELIEYYNSVIKWVKGTFTVYRKEMKGIDWGILYNKYHTNKYTPEQIEEILSELYNQYDIDGDGMHKSGFYEYALSGDRTLIWKRIFSEKQQRTAYMNQGKRCGGRCGRPMAFNELEAHHRIAYTDGGKTTIDNCVMLCHDCHADHSESHQRQRYAHPDVAPWPPEEKP